MTALLAATLLLLGNPQPCPRDLSAAIEHVESRGHALAVSRTVAALERLDMAAELLICEAREGALWRRRR